MKWNIFLTKIKNFGCPKFVSKCIKELNLRLWSMPCFKESSVYPFNFFTPVFRWSRLTSPLCTSRFKAWGLHYIFKSLFSTSGFGLLSVSVWSVSLRHVHISSNWAHATSGINRTFDQTINIPLVRKLPSFSFPLQISPIANSLHGLHQISFRTTLYKPASSWKLECITVPQKKCYRVMLSANSNRFHQKSGCAVFLSCEYFITWPRNKVDKYGFAG